MSQPPVSRSVRVLLQTDPTQTLRLQALQEKFAQACNELAPLVQSSACWNRVALHHMAYRLLRERFPGLGSQMVCNVIYSVSRTSRLVFQHKDSPFNIQRLNGQRLPLLRFSPTSPVFFDRHTLSVKDGKASMYTLDGRMRFQLQLGADDERRFRTERLGEIVLHRVETRFGLIFTFGPAPDGTDANNLSDVDGVPDADSTAALRRIQTPLAMDTLGRLPGHVNVIRLPEMPAVLPPSYASPSDQGMPHTSNAQQRP